MIKFIEKLLNLIYVQPCYFCKSIKEDKIICSRCYGKIHFLPSGVFRQNEECNIYACTIYDEIIKKLIKDLKYHNQRRLAPLFAYIMANYWKKLGLMQNYLILPVPIHKSRRKERRYNHMDIVAQEFSKITNYKLNKDFLIRIKDTEKQYKLHKQERIKNIKNAFDINKNINLDKNTNLLILDDITSTGITLEEIIKVLKKNGYYNITALTLATPDIWN